jgi:APA family basic amino acid/polyamine antiporter
VAEHKPISDEPLRVIRGLGAFAIVAGSMLGIGIFLSPPIVAAQTSSEVVFYLLWLLGGLTALAGGVACAELGTMMPRAGGDYVYQYEAFGPSVAFASGWVLFAAIFCGSIATLSVGLCTYQLPVLLGIDLSWTVLELPWGRELSAAEVAALLVIPALTGLNGAGARTSARTQTLLTLVPIVLLAGMAIYAIVHGGGDSSPGFASAEVAPSAGTLRGFVVAYMAVYFAYSGWINIIYVAGEVSEPQRNIPRSLIWGTVGVCALYLLICVGFLRVLGLDGLRDAGEAGTATAGILAGTPGRIAITTLIAIALLASLNGTVLGGARIAYAMAKRGAMWPLMGTVDEGHRVPQRALWVQSLLACLLVLSGKFEQLYTMVSLAMVVTGTLTVASLFVLRRTRPGAPRPYRASLYPLLPALYIVSSVGVVAVMVWSAVSGERDAWYPLLGLGLLILIFVSHAVLARSRRDRPQA